MYIRGKINMMKNKKFTKIGIIVVSLLAMVFVGVYIQDALAAKPIELIVDGENITEMAKPVIKEDRSLVPIRAITEKLNGKVNWDGENRIVEIEKDGRFINLKIDSRLISYGKDVKTYGLSDIAPVIINDLTYVPLRLVSNALNIGIEWDEEDRNIYVDSKKSSDIKSQFDVELVTPVSGQEVAGEIPLQLVIGDLEKEAKDIKYLLLDPISAKGFIIDRGELLTGEYKYSPKMEDKGEKVIVAALYDKNGKFIAGDAMGIRVNPKPNVILQGIQQDEVIEDSVKLEVKMNFSPKYVKYEIKNLKDGTVILSESQDPYGSYSWAPDIHKSGEYEFKTIAYDEEDRAYPSKSVSAKVYPPYKLALTGVKQDMIIKGPVTLGAVRNFDVSETQFVLVDSRTSKEEILSTQGYGNYTWFPGLEYNGDKKLLVRVKDTRGQVHESKAVDVKLQGKPQIIVRGIGPKQVITPNSDVKISSISNVKLDSIEYILENPKTGKKKSLKTLKDYNESFGFTPKADDEGDRIFRAIAMYNGERIKSEDIPLKIYLGEIYGPTPIIEKDQFLGFASNLAKESYRDTDMSAALQTAQAILETGWGQSIPTDKYTGKISNNLFGIKGKAAAGAVISNTWEEYNGEVYRVDAEFRAYNNTKDSWKDHKLLLLEAERYSIFRDVMYDSTKGAWAIRRAGYATDSKYPLKLMEIIDSYNLRELDKVGI